MERLDPMAQTGVKTLDHTVQKTIHWLDDVGAALGVEDRHASYAALRAVLHALRDRLPVDEAANLSAQLPLMIRGIYYEQFVPSDMPVKLRDRQSFLDRVSEELASNSVTFSPHAACEAVFRTLNKHLTPGEATGARNMLNDELKALWPQAA